MNRFNSELKLVLLVLLIVFPLFNVMRLIPDVEAEQGSAKVYILQLSDVGAWGVDDPSQVKEGAIEASTPAGKLKNIPRAHPKYGQTSPFYSVSYQVINGWSAYMNVILNEVGVIIVNTHGEILPVPSGYTKETWVDTIASAMIYRRLTWAHMAGYPFYHVWYEGASDKTSWGVDGFKALMSHIGLGNVELWPPETGLDAPLTGEADQYLYSSCTGWYRLHNYAHSVDLSRPLKKSDFADCTILPLYRRVRDSEVYWEGAIIAFAKSGVRLDPEETEGFGSFVHLGTGQTYDELGNPTNRDYSRGYVATAAAIWVEALGFESHSAFNSNNDPYYPRDVSIHVAPVIAGYWWEPGGTFSVRIVLGLYGALKARQGDDAHTVNEVGIILKNTPDNVLMQAKLDISKNGEETGIKLEGLWEEDPLKRTLGLLASTVVWMLPAPYGMAVSGIILFSKWAFPIDQYHEYEGVDHPSSTVHFDYDPKITYTSEGGYRYEEFQSLIAIDVNVPISGRSDWRVIPIDFWVKLFTLSGWDVEVEAGLSIAMWFDPSNNVMVLFEDFEEDMSEWSVGDNDGAAGYDYWGISTVQAHTAWCAQVGDNSITGTSNVEAEQYDNGMDAYLMREVDLRPYQSAELSYFVDYWIKAGDYLRVQYHADDSWSTLKSYTDDMEGKYDAVSVPINAQKIRFLFTSNNDDDVAWGAFIDSVQITAIIPNDAINQSIDAGNDFDSATEIEVSECQKNYAGYLDPEYQDDCQDWYRFHVASGKRILVILHSPQSADFDVEIYSPTNEKKAGPGSYVYVWTDTTGDWRVKVYIVSGFGQYSFDINVISLSGCPFVYTWNGTKYVIDNNLLRDSEAGGGTDVDDYYRLEQALAPKYDGYRFSRYSLQIHEFENEHSYVDQVKLLAVDHESDVNVAVSPTGEILTYKNPHVPISAIDNHGNNQSDAISTIDDKYYEGYADDYILLNFGDLDTSDGAKLLLRTDLKPLPVPYSIHIQILDETWETITTIAPRVYWATDIVDLSSYLPDAESDLQVRLYFTSHHKLDYVGLDTNEQADFVVYDANLVFAFHSQEGRVLFKLLFKDNDYAELVPGEHIKLTFILPKQSSETRTFVIYTKGHYTM